MILKTARDEMILRKRSTGVADAEEMFALVERNRSFLRVFLSWIDRTTTFEQFVETQTMLDRHMEEGHSLSFYMIYNEQVIGEVAFVKIEHTIKMAEVGYFMDRDHSGKGMMTEAVRTLIKYGFEELELNKIVIKSATNNIRSQKIPQRLGMHFEGTIRANQLVNGEFLDHEQYSILKSEYEAGKLL